MKAILPFFLLLSLFLTGCATPIGFSQKPMANFDRDTLYNIEDAPDGFTVNVYFSRYQFIPETPAVISAAKASALSIAYNTAHARQRPIKPPNEQRIRVSTGRNGFTGITSCTVQVPVEYE